MAKHVTISTDEREERIELDTVLSKSDRIVLDALNRNDERFSRHTLVRVTGLGYLAVTLALYRLTGLGLIRSHETRKGGRATSPYGPRLKGARARIR